MIISRATSCCHECEGKAAAVEVEAPGTCGGCNQGSCEGKRKPAEGKEFGRLAEVDKHDCVLRPTRFWAHSTDNSVVLTSIAIAVQRNHTGFGGANMKADRGQKKSIIPRVSSTRPAHRMHLQRNSTQLLVLLKIGHIPVT
jgi:hypothetical protein